MVSLLSASVNWYKPIRIMKLLALKKNQKEWGIIKRDQTPRIQFRGFTALREFRLNQREPK